VVEQVIGKTYTGRTPDRNIPFFLSEKVHESKKNRKEIQKS
jgi:hypothetical protein